MNLMKLMPGKPFNILFTLAHPIKQLRLKLVTGKKGAQSFKAYNKTTRAIS